MGAEAIERSGTFFICRWKKKKETLPAPQRESKEESRTQKVRRWGKIPKLVVKKTEGAESADGVPLSFPSRFQREEERARCLGASGKSDLEEVRKLGVVTSS